MATAQINPAQKKEKPSPLDIFAKTTGIISALVPTVSGLTNMTKTNPLALIGKKQHPNQY